MTSARYIGENAPAVLRLDAVTKRYGSIVALNSVSLSLGRGEILAVLGPNGAGKTTLMSIIAGLAMADEGQVLIDGNDVTRTPDRGRDRLGFAPQDLGIYPPVTVQQNLGYFGQLAGLAGAALSARVDEVASALGIKQILRRRAGTLSGGEKRRVHTAMALMGDPRLLLLDEPTVGVDVETRQRLLEVIKQISRRGCAICYSTHYLPEVEVLDATEVLVLHEGTVVAVGSMQSLIAGAGASLLELRFDGVPPSVLADMRAEEDGSMVRFWSPNPEVELGRIISQLGADTARLRSVEIKRPTLESVFLKLTTPG